MASHSDMDLILDMVPDDNVLYENVDVGDTNEYYQGLAAHTLKSITNEEHYFHFVQTILQDYQRLTSDHKQAIQDTLGIKPEIHEKVVFKEKIVYKEKKRAAVNTYDDY
jgi:hypothetical protein